MTTFFTDTDLVGAGTFVESPAVNLSTEFDLPAGTITRMRARWAADNAPTNTPAMRVYNAAGAEQTDDPVPFDTTDLDAWNWATPDDPVHVAAGVYRVAWDTTRYRALGGFFAGGPITRGDITAIQSKFATSVIPPTSTSTATYYVDIDFTPDGDEPTGLAVSVWNGSTELPAGVTVWNGTAEVDAVVDEVTA